MAAAATTTTTAAHDLPDVILSNILAMVTDIRYRNAASLVCRKWMALERLTRTRLTLRGNVRDLFMVPTCFRSVTHLDLSLLSPWGHQSILSPSSSAYPADPSLLAYRLRLAFPSVVSLTLYARSPITLSLLSPHWPSLSEIKLVRWHQRPQSPLGSDFFSLFENCPSLTSLDLSCFYCWTEDLPPALNGHPALARNLSSLDLLNYSFAEGFKSHEIIAIATACPNLKRFLVACVFDPRYVGFVGDDALVAIPSNCRKLRVLHLVDIAASQDVDADGFAGKDVGFSMAALFQFFDGLDLVEELVLDVGKNVRDSGMALEVLATKCPNLRSLKLGQFHGLCVAIESHLDGIALCHGLESLSISNCADLTDLCLIEIARGCSKLAKFEVQGCMRITVKGMQTMACLLRSSLVHVEISQCQNLDAAASLQAVEPIRDRIQRLHMDCKWDDDDDDDDDQEELDQFGIGRGEQEVEMSYQNYDFSDYVDIQGNLRKRIKFSSDYSNGYWQKTWTKLQFLSLRISVGKLLKPLVTLGLEHCPNLEEIQIRVEGDCRERPKPAHRAFGLVSLARYPKLSKMKLDCADIIGYALTAPSGHADLSLWERFYLNGVESLMSLSELDYWPPQDPEVNHRSLSMPAAGLLAQCNSLRKLFVHGTTYEHFIMFLLRIDNLRDVQLREDYYPAPEDDMSTEMRVNSCCRFEDALNMRRIPD
ncbi:F-box/LRR-repeat MAX2 A [Dionaea muscipula]